MHNQLTLKKLAITSAILMALNLLLTYYISGATEENSPYKTATEIASSLFIWRIIILAFMPSVCFAIAVVASFFMNKLEPISKRLVRSFLTSVIALYLLLALPLIFVICYKLIRDGF